MLSILNTADAAVSRWPENVREVQIVSTADGVEQSAMFCAPASDQSVPLLVSLHTWQGRYTQLAGRRARWCLDNQWAFIHPDFRGPNNTPEAMGSDLVVQDILDAVAYARAQVKIDENRIYLLGFSGGGYTALLMAGRAPDVWAGVSAWCAISDLEKWHGQSPGYGRQIERAVGGNPRHDPQAAAECVRRSPVTWLENAKHIAIDIAAGIHDGHTGSVPVSQSLEAFNLLARPADRLNEQDIIFITRERAIPGHLESEDGGDRLFGRARIHFQRQSGNARITIFEGGHTGFDGVALPWLAIQRKDTDAVWDDDVKVDDASPDEDAAATGL